MAKRAPHLVLAGGGLANCLVALRIRARHPDTHVTIVEAGDRPGGNHTWSFHAGDLGGDQRRLVEPMVRYRWPAQRVVFPRYERRLACGYASIPSDALAEHVESQAGLRMEMGRRVTAIRPDSVLTDAGDTIEGTAVLDGRGPDSSDGMILGFQKFVGREVVTERPHGVELPVIMDASVSQADGYRFVYVLPFDQRRLLIEDTRYSDGAELSRADLVQAIDEYADASGWRIAETLREEDGVLPILLAGDFERFWPADPDAPARAGLRAGLFHPTTGYSLPQAVALADAVAAHWPMDGRQLARFTREFARAFWARTGLFRLLNRMLFWAGRPEGRYRVMQRFYRLSEPLITNFYAGRLTLAQKTRILVGKPPVPFFNALRLVPERPYLPKE